MKPTNQLVAQDWNKNYRCHIKEQWNLNFQTSKTPLCQVHCKVMLHAYPNSNHLTQAFRKQNILKIYRTFLSSKNRKPNVIPLWLCFRVKLSICKESLFRDKTLEWSVKGSVCLLLHNLLLTGLVSSQHKTFV